MKICLRIMYDGKNYSGFQRQTKSYAVQNILENCLEKVHGYFIKTYGASRTDAGVHALDNLVIFETNKDYPPQKWVDILNFILPQDIKVKSSYRACDNFLPLGFKSKKTYCYRINNSIVENPLTRGIAFHIAQPLDFNKMKEAVTLFEGEHDFNLFRNGTKEYETTKRIIFSSYIIQNGDFLEYRISGNGFMYNMVRNIVGTIIDVGRGKKSCEDIIRALKNIDKINMSATAPAHGLVLEQVDYYGKEVYHG